MTQEEAKLIVKAQLRAQGLKFNCIDIGEFNKLVQVLLARSANTKPTPAETMRLADDGGPYGN